MADTYNPVVSRVLSNEVHSDEINPDENNEIVQILENDNEESTLVKLSPALENVVKSLPRDATQNDYLIALIILVVKEVDLHVKRTNDRGDFTSDFDTNQWKTKGAYELFLEHRQIRELNCKLDVIPVGDVAILNLTSVNQSIKTRSCVFETLEYINLYSGDLSSRFMNLKKFSHKFKDALTTPIRDEILNDMGVVNPSLLGLPEEIRRKIAKMLSQSTDKGTEIHDKHWWEQLN